MAEKTSSSKSKNIVTIFLLLIICGLTAGSSYLLYENHKKDILIDSYTEKLSQASTKEDSLSIALDQEIQKLTHLKEKYEDLDHQNQELNVLIAELNKGKLEWENRANLSKKQIADLQNELKKSMTEYNNKRLSMLKEIEELKNFATQLGEKNKNLLFSNDSLLAASQDQLTVNKGILKKASRLKAENLRMEVKGKNDKTINRAPFKSSSILTISSVFNLSKNDLAEKGKHLMVMRIEKPDGGILYDISANGNTFTTSNNQEFYYTVANNINFKNEYDEIVLTYNKQSELSEGIYKVVVYLDGDDIGTTSFEIK